MSASAASRADLSVWITAAIPESMPNSRRRFGSSFSISSSASARSRRASAPRRGCQGQRAPRYSGLHPLLRMAISVFVLADADAVITDADRTPEFYARAGLPANESSLHFRQDDGFVHALDLRTLNRPEWRNLAAELAFRAMGFHTLRHVGTGRPPACVVEVAGVAADGNHGVRRSQAGGHTDLGRGPPAPRRSGRRDPGALPPRAFRATHEDLPWRLHASLRSSGAP